MLELAIELILAPIHFESELYNGKEDPADGRDQQLSTNIDLRFNISNLPVEIYHYD